MVFWCVLSLLFCGVNVCQLKCCDLHFLFPFSGSFVWNWFDFLSPLPIPRHFVDILVCECLQVKEGKFWFFFLFLCFCFCFNGWQ